jgi:hypothetical protein
VKSKQTRWRCALKQSVWTLVALLLGAAILSFVPQQLPNGYLLESGDRGKTWVTDPKGFIVFSSVKAAGVVGSHVLVETRHGRLTAPYGYAPCEYFLLDTRTGITRAVASENPEAIQLTREAIRRHEVTRTSRSCSR